MKESLHYLLMSDHQMLQKALVSRVKDTGLTPGQPKILDYLLNHDGAIQKDIAVFCHIEPASLTVILSGMENKGYIKRQTDNGNRRSLHVYLTDIGRTYANRLQQEFLQIESHALDGFSASESQQFHDFLERIYKNMLKEGNSK